MRVCIGAKIKVVKVLMLHQMFFKLKMHKKCFFRVQRNWAGGEKGRKPSLSPPAARVRNHSLEHCLPNERKLER